jgi:hypothetical protein
VDTAWRLDAAGLVEESVPEGVRTARKRIILVWPTDRPPPAVSAVPGIDDVRSDQSGRRVEILVAPDAVDTVLRGALRDGWSVELVTPSPGVES